MHAGGDFTDISAISNDFIVFAGNATAGQFQSNQNPLCSAGLPRFNGAAPQKITLIQPGDPHQSGFDRGDAVTDLMAVEGVTHFGAQHVTCSQTDGNSARIFQCLPHGYGIAVGQVDFKSIFTCVTGTGDNGLRTLKRRDSKAVVTDLIKINLCEALQQRLCSLTLKCQECRIIRFIGNSNLEAGCMLFQMSDILVPVGCIDAEIVAVFIDAIGSDIINECALIIEQGRVLYLSIHQP